MLYCELLEPAILKKLPVKTVFKAGTASLKTPSKRAMTNTIMPALGLTSGVTCGRYLHSAAVGTLFSKQFLSSHRRRHC